MALRKRQTDLTKFPLPGIDKNWDQTNVLDGDLALVDTSPVFKSGKTNTDLLDAQYSSYIEIGKPPYIFRDIGQRWDPNGSPTTTSLGIVTGVTRRAADVSRIAQWMVSGQGIVWNITQAGLQASNPKVEVLGSIRPSRIYNPIKLMANVGFAGTGVHFTRFGLTPDDYNYGKVQEQLRTSNQLVTQDITTSENRLIKLGLELNKFQFDTYDNSEKEITKIGKAVKDINSFLQKIGLKQSGEPIELISGTGGPKSLYGIGWTDFFKSNHGIQLDVSQQYFQAKQGPTRYAFRNYNDLEKYAGGDVIIDSDFGILKGTNTLEMYNSNQQPGDYQGGLTMIPSADLNDYNKYIDINDATNFESQKKYINRKREEDRDKKFNPFTIDLFKRNEVGRNIADQILSDPDANDEPDFVILRFTRDGERLQFRATVSALNDRFAHDWGEQKYTGRPDSVYIFKGMKRSINFTFIVAIQHQDERDGAWQKLNKLVQFTSPKLTNGRMIGPIMYLQIGDYFNSGQNAGQPGYISSLDLTIEDDYPWDLDIKRPMYAKISVNFEVIGAMIPSDTTVYFGAS